MKYIGLAVLLVLLVGCNGKNAGLNSEPTPLSSTPVASAQPSGPDSSAGQAASSQVHGTTVAADSSPDPVTLRYLSAQMKSMQFLDATISYPENFEEPRTDSQGGSVLRFETGDLTIYRAGHTSGQSLSEMVDEFVDTNVKAATGRFAVTAKGSRQLGGRDAGFVQAYFPSAAGRWDRVFYFVVVGDSKYRVSCGTKQGLPVIPWEQVAPICQHLLNTLQFGSRTGL